MLIDGRLIPCRARLRADVVVIGAGPAGITVTEELAASGHDVVLLEAAGRHHERADDDALEGEGSGVPFPLVRSRRRGFGGTSGHWTPATGLRVRELDDVDFEARSGRGGSWPFGRDELAPYYKRAHASIDCHGRYDAGRWFDAATATPLAWPGGPELAMFQFADHDCFVRRFDSLVADPHADVVLQASVRTIDVSADGATASSVSVVCPDGNEFSVDAPIFVLAAGGIENARVLLASPGRTGSGLGNENDNVGRWFMDHLSVDTGIIVTGDGPSVTAEVFLEHRSGDDRHQPMLWLGDDRIRREALPNAAFWINDLDPSYMSSGVGAARSLKSALHGTPRQDIGKHLGSTARGALDLVTYARTKAPSRRPRPRVMGLRILTEQIPDRDSRITLASARDRRGMPRVNLEWRIADQDLATIRRHQDVLAGLLEARGVGTVADRFERDRHPSPIMSNYHHVGSTRMHVDPRHGVVDADCRIHGTPNVFVAGGSVFPTGGYLNPTLTIIAIAHRVADAVRRDLRPTQVVSGSRP